MQYRLPWPVKMDARVIKPELVFWPKLVATAILSPPTNLTSAVPKHFSRTHSKLCVK